LEELRRLETEATKGPWVIQDLSDATYSSKDGTGWWWVWQESKLPYYGGVLNPNERTDRGVLDGAIGECAIDDNETGVQEKADAEFIVAARNQLPRILDALDAVQALADKWDVIFTGHSAEDRAKRAATHLIRATITKAMEEKQ
jgi:hypothetical protein